MFAFVSFFLVFTLIFASCKAEVTQKASATTNTSLLKSVSLSQIENELTSIVEAVSPSVVTIFATQRVSSPIMDFPFPIPFLPQERPSLGSGVIMYYKNDKFYILTNSHVVKDGRDIKVKFDEYTEKRAKIVGVDPRTDVAVIEVDTKGIENPERRVAKLGDSDKLKVGQIVIAIGNPYGLERTVTVGVISALKRSIGITQYESFIQTDAPINPGNSGGPLVNIKGEVIGINTAILAEGQGLGFSIPINLAKWIADQLIEKGKVTRGWLGVVIQEVTSDISEAIGIREGVIIAQIMPGSPAEKAGLKIGDIVLSVDGEKVKSVRDLQFKIMKTPPGNELKLVVLRDGKEIQINVKVGEMPEERQATREQQDTQNLGLSLRNLTPQEESRLGTKGVLITGIMPGSLAHISGLRPGDVILMVNNVPVSSVDQVRSMLDSLIKSERERALLLVRRNQENLYIALRLR